MGVRKVKYGAKAAAVTTVIKDLAEEIIDLASRLECDNFDASAQLVEQHYEGLVERVQVRADILAKLAKMLDSR